MFSQFKKVKTLYSAICLFCKFKFKFMRHSSMSLLYPHFYCDSCSKVIFRRSDFDKLMVHDKTPWLVEEIVKTLPPCRCGGSFTSKACPKCPKCKCELSCCNNELDCLSNLYLVVISGAKVFFE